VSRQLSGSEYAAAFRAGFPLTRRFLISRGAAWDEAEEIAQAAWARGWEYRVQLHDRGRVAVWVNSIAKHLLLAHYSRKKRFESLTETVAGLDGGEVSASADLSRVLSRCRPDDREFLLGLYVDGRTTGEIASEAGVTPTAIRVRLMRLRQRLRKQLTPARRDTKQSGQVA
jgi:RNA polymerase sigma factor (sigma-70 family)